MGTHNIPFNKSNYQENTINYIREVLASGHSSGDGKYTKLCNRYIEERAKAKHCLITHSCTAALEISASLLDAEDGSEIIMPSYTFVSTANAFVLRGLKPIFIDVRDDNCNMDEKLIEAAISKKTRAIVPVHYAGVACDMDEIEKTAKKYNLTIIEDAAQAYGSYYKNKHLGTIGSLGTFSFHETKNIISGEGGALIINDERFIERARIIREKGTNRDRFFKGQVDKYTWVDLGSSYLPSDIISAYLYSNLEIEDFLQDRRIKIWNSYNSAFSEFEKMGKIKLPFINDFATNNAHMFYIRFNEANIRDNFIKYMRENKIMTPFHYIPLHSSEGGMKFGKVASSMKNTDKISETLVRLPLFYNLSEIDVEYIVSRVVEFLKKF